MDAAGSTRPKFRRKPQPVTFVVARGETVRHVTLERRHVVRFALSTCLASAVVAGLSILYVPAPELPTVPEEHALRQAYEIRLAALRTKLDEATSRQFVTQKLVETKVDILLDQQEQIAERYDRLEPIFDRARQNGILPDPIASETPLPSPRPDVTNAASIDAPVSAYAPSETGLAEDRIFGTLIDTAPGQTPDLDPMSTASLGSSDGIPTETALASVGNAIDHAETQQISNLETLVSEASLRASKISKVLSSVGFDVTAEPDMALGGPFETAPEEDLFDAQIGELEVALDRLEGLRGLSSALPFRAPMSQGRITSRFGVRSDPFLGKRALHAGIDYAARTGTPIKATASGTVTRAGRAGGYGNLVEIDHGNGLTTRFGHMSRIDVEIGQSIERGDVIGAVGSTGRSTGSHLHYEIRKNGKAIDPIRFIQAGAELQKIV